MDVFRNVETEDRAILSTSGNHRYLTLEAYEAFENLRHATQRLKGTGGVILRTLKDLCPLPS